MIRFFPVTTATMPSKLQWVYIAFLLLVMALSPSSSAFSMQTAKSKRLSNHALIRLMLQRDLMKYGDSSRVHRSSRFSENRMRKRFIIVGRPQKTDEDTVIEQFY